jgi:type I restriction enzyme S subunit
MSSDWGSYQLTDLATFKYGKFLPKSSLGESGFPVFSGYGIVGYLPTHQFSVPQLLIVCRGEGGTGDVKMSPSNCSITNLSIVITPNEDKVTKSFLYWALKTSDTHQLRTGSAQAQIVIGALETFRVAIPSNKKVQEAIANLLNSLDDRIALLRETSGTLEAIAQALFKSWFVDFDPVHAKAQGIAPEGMDEATAALFPDGFEESELGLVPRGWGVGKFEDFIKRIPVGKKYEQKTASPIGSVPILDQGRSGIIGFHDDVPGVIASLEKPVVVFANHTCYMRLITYPFSAIQNVLPFIGNGVDTVWAYYATKDRIKFSEYKGHYPDFAIEKAVIPEEKVTTAFRNIVDPIVRRVRLNEINAEALATLRDTLLPRLISGQLRLPEAEEILA